MRAFATMKALSIVLASMVLATVGASAQFGA